VAHIGKAEAEALTQRRDADRPVARADLSLMPYKQNTFEGGTDTTTITTANSGDASGTPWDSIVIGTDATIQFSTTRASQGTLSGRFATGATSAVANVRWDLPDTNELFTRLYLYLPSTAPLPVQFVFTDTGTGSGMGRFQIMDSTGPKLRVFSQGGAFDSIGTIAVTRDAWIRLETRTKVDPASGVIEAKLFNSPDISTPDETVTITGIANTEIGVGRVRFGITQTLATCEIWLDSVAVETSGYLGPYSEPQEGSSRRVIIA
jgi:hypothetical protein